MVEINNIWYAVNTVANAEKQYTFSEKYRVDTKNHERIVRKKQMMLNSQGSFV